MKEKQDTDLNWIGIYFKYFERKSEKYVAQ